MSSYVHVFQCAAVPVPSCCFFVGHQGGPNLILAQPQILAPLNSRVVGYRKGGATPIQSPVCSGCSTLHMCTRFMFDLTSHELLGLFSVSNWLSL